MVLFNDWNVILKWKLKCIVWTNVDNNNVFCYESGKETRFWDEIICSQVVDSLLNVF